jgi:hypothetical protein
MFERCLSSNERTADVDRKNAIEVRKFRLFDWTRNDRASVVHQYVKPAKCFDRSFDSVSACVGVGGVRLDSDRLSAVVFDRFDDRRSGLCAFRLS